jgi:hypothetical protein
MTNEEHRKAVARAYQDALRRLRKAHDPEFHSYLAEIYEERGINVKKRRSHQQVKVDEIEAARRLLESVQDSA